MASVLTATGPIDTADMGFTLMHEHALVIWPPYYQQYPEKYDRAALMERAVGNLKTAVEGGVKTMVDLTPIDLVREVGDADHCADGLLFSASVPLHGPG